ncbi:hypothetical protein NW765_005778 [Fusarium oxysporum]|nr:hypothetical protein NW765_005778 [Fusarium oxysporum]
MDTPTVSLVGQINDLNARICSKVASIQKYVQTCPIGERFSPTQTFRDERFYVMQPLFKAVTIILLNDEYDVRMVDVGKMPALLTLTGEEDGLSQQLSFKSISDKYVSTLRSNSWLLNKSEKSLSMARNPILSSQRRSWRTVRAVTCRKYENLRTNWAGLENLSRAQARRGLILRFIQNGLEMAPKTIRIFMEGWRIPKDGMFFFGLLG